MMTELTLTGPNGSNPLGFLCALGTLRALSNAWPDANVKMAWKQMGAAWRPVLQVDHADLDGKTEEEVKNLIVKVLFAELQKMEGHPAFNFCYDDEDQTAWDTTNVTYTEYRRYCCQATESMRIGDRKWTDFAAAFGCDGAFNTKDKIYDTPFRFLSGNQKFLEVFRAIVSDTTTDHLSEAVFGPWMYQDDGRKKTLRWDPNEYRKHAFRWQDPNSDKIIPTVRGANRLGIEALPLFSTLPVGSRSQTTGFDRRNRQFTWPIWRSFISLRLVQSVLALKDLCSERPDRAQLSRMGIEEVFRSTRTALDNNREEGYRNFTPAKPV
jgi:hypothetical protein